MHNKFDFVSGSCFAIVYELYVLYVLFSIEKHTEKERVTYCNVHKPKHIKYKTAINIVFDMIWIEILLNYNSTLNTLNIIFNNKTFVILYV